MCIYISLDCKPAYVKRARYTFEVLFDTLGFAYTFVDPEHGDKLTQGVLILYGQTSRSKAPVQEKLAKILISETWVEDIDRIQVGYLLTPQGKKLPVLGEESGEITQNVASADDTAFLVEKDLIFSSFFFLSRWEEVESKAADKHGRFPTEESLSYAHQFSQRAVVNEYLKLLLELICRVARLRKIPLVRKCFWPNGEKLAVCLTHDVDIIDKWHLYSLVRAFELIETGQLSSSLKTLWGSFRALVSGKNPALAFDQLTTTEDKFSFKSSFYFIMGKPKVKALLRSDITYDLSKSKILKKAKQVLENGFEVGLHASYNTSLDPDLLLKEKKEVERLIDSPISGLRQHFLRCKIPESWVEQRDSGFLYDTSLGFPDQSGYRASFAFPFYAYDLRNDQKLDLMELPLAIMDRTYSKYLSFSPKQIKQDIIKTFQELEDFGGLVTILWHTHMVDELGFSGYPRLYEKILDFVHKKGYFVAPGREIAEWWSKRKGLELKCRSAGDQESSWEFAASDSLDKVSLELIGARAGKARVDGCSFDIVREGEHTVVKLDGIRKGAKITLGIKTA